MKQRLPRSMCKDRGLVIQLSSYAKPTFYQCIVSRQPLPLPKGAHSFRWPAVECIVYYRTGGVTRDNSIVYDVYCLAARLTVHAKIDSYGILPHLCNLWYACNPSGRNQGSVVDGHIPADGHVCEHRHHPRPSCGNCRNQ